MVWIPWSLRVIGVGLLMMTAALGLFSMSAEAAPPHQYPPVCPCVVTVSMGEGPAHAGTCIPVTCKATDTEGAPVVDLECTMSVISPPGTDATVTPTSVMTDQNGEATAELCVGSAPGPVVVEAETDCCGSKGQVEVTVPGLPPLDVTPTPVPPAEPPHTGGGTGSGGSSPAWLIAIYSGIALAAGSLLVWGIGSRRRRSS